MSGLRRFLDRADIRRFRFWVQLAAFAVLVYGGYLAINLGQHLPTFACGFNQDGRGGICYFLPLQHQLHITWASLFSWRGVAILTGFLTFVFWLIVLNKAWCGYVCPLGTIQDWITRLRQRLGVRYSAYREATQGRLRWVKFVLLGLMILIPLAIANPIFGEKLPYDMGTPFCKICPARMVIPVFTADLSQLTIDFSTKTAMVMTALGMGVTGFFFIGAFVRRRFFCLFCPMSALHYLFTRIAFLRLRKDGDKCTRCGDCYRVCDMQIKAIADDVETKEIVKDDCMMCFKCVAACPEQDALKVTFLGAPIYRSTDDGFRVRMERAAQREEKK
jgi:ferredoxin-type protein NapH